MGTRSTIHFFDDKKHVCSIYQQYDGYLSGVGKDLYNFLSSGIVVNGYTMDKQKQFNGVGCLVAQFISEHKKGVGNLYITDKKDRQEYDYFVIVKDFKITIKVKSGGLLFKGNLDDFHALIQKGEVYND